MTSSPPPKVCSLEEYRARLNRRLLEPAVDDRQVERATATIAAIRQAVDARPRMTADETKIVAGNMDRLLRKANESRISLGDLCTRCGMGSPAGLDKKNDPKALYHYRLPENKTDRARLVTNAEKYAKIVKELAGFNWRDEGDLLRALFRDTKFVDGAIRGAGAAYELEELFSDCVNWIADETKINEAFRIARECRIHCLSPVAWPRIDGIVLWPELPLFRIQIPIDDLDRILVGGNKDGWVWRCVSEDLQRIDLHFVATISLLLRQDEHHKLRASLSVWSWTSPGLLAPSGHLDNASIDWESIDEESDTIKISREGLRGWDQDANYVTLTSPQLVQEWDRLTADGLSAVDIQNRLLAERNFCRLNLELKFLRLDNETLTALGKGDLSAYGFETAGPAQIEPLPALKRWKDFRPPYGAGVLPGLLNSFDSLAESLRGMAEDFADGVLGRYQVLRVENDRELHALRDKFRERTRKAAQRREL